MVRSKESLALGRKLGSKASPAPAAIALTPGKSGCGRVGLAAGMGAVRPSQPPAVGPTRKTLLGLVVPVVPHDIFPFAAAAAGLYGAKHCTGWMRPVPSSGTRARSTPFKRRGPGPGAAARH